MSLMCILQYNTEHYGWRPCQQMGFLLFFSWKLRKELVYEFNLHVLFEVLGGGRWFLCRRFGLFLFFFLEAWKRLVCKSSLHIHHSEDRLCAIESHEKMRRFNTYKNPSHQIAHCKSVSLYSSFRSQSNSHTYFPYASPSSSLDVFGSGLIPHISNSRAIASFNHRTK